MTRNLKNFAKFLGTKQGLSGGGGEREGGLLRSGPSDRIALPAADSRPNFSALLVIFGGWRMMLRYIATVGSMFNGPC